MSLKGALQTLYLFFIGPVEVTGSVLLQLVLGLHPAGRPSPKWSLGQAVKVRLVSAIVRMRSVGGLAPRLSLAPGAEGSRFAIVPALTVDRYVGPLADPEIRPRATGGTWTPAAPTRARTTDPKDLLVCLYFHGGAYVVGDGRDKDAGFAAKIMHKHAGCTHVFSSQYRLATTPENRFPAQLQDAVSAYLYLTEELGVPADRIVFSGDSAGGNLVLALLRYIHFHGEQVGLQRPLAAVLWSPWSDITVGLEKANVPKQPNYGTDYIGGDFVNWGVTGFTGNGKISASDPYVSPCLGPMYKSPVPIWVQTGGREILFQENERLVKGLKEAGTVVDWVVEPEAPHDIALLGAVLGFHKEAIASAKKAGEFIKRAEG